MPNDFTKIAWPVLRFGSPNCVLLRYDTQDRLCNVTYTSLKAINSMQEYFLIDSAGRKLALGEAKIEVALSHIGRAIARFTNRRIRIVYPKCYLAGELSMDEVRALVFKNWTEEADFWSESPLNELRREIEAAETIGKLIRLF